MSTRTESADLSSLKIPKDARDTGSSGGKAPWRIIIAGALLLIIAGIVWSGFFGGSSAVEVELGTASMTYPSQANAILSASGYVVARQKASVASKGTGRLLFLGVEEGDRVKEGQVIARLEDGDVVAGLAQAEANVELARADSVDAAQSLSRIRALASSGLASQAELDVVEARHLRVQAAIRAAKATVSAAQVALENTRIRAPFDGTVLTKDADVGEVVAPFAAGANSRGAVVTMADMNSLEVEADVSESNIARIRPGQPCEITLDAAPDRRYRGFVHKIVPTADRAKATIEVKIRFRERDDSVLPEMGAKVQFLSEEPDAGSTPATPRLTVPLSSVVQRDNQDVVFHLDENTARARRVTTGQVFGDRIHILSGVAEGDRVVLRPDASMQDGNRIRTRQQ